MDRKIAIKRLSASDLTFFEYHYRRTAGTKQKAFNLDRSILIDGFFPSLPIAVGGAPVKVALSIRGPGIAPSQNLMRKIIKQEKNWRLNGELIFDPPDNAGQYAPLQKGDFAVIEFIGSVVPDLLTIQLVAQTHAEDKNLYAALNTKYGASFSLHRGMISPDPDDFFSTLAVAEIDTSHPINDFLEAEYLEDVVLGGLRGLETLTKRRRGRTLTKSEFEQSKENAARIGRLGEELVNTYLTKLLEDGQISQFEWTSDLNPIASYDFAIQTANVISRKIDVKSTSGKQNNPVHVSMAELVEMIQSTVPYEIYRVHEVNERSGMLAVSTDLRGVATAIADSLKDLPMGVTPDGFSIDSALLQLCESKKIVIPDYEEPNA